MTEAPARWPISLVAQGFSLTGSRANCAPRRSMVSTCPTACSLRPGLARRKCAGVRAAEHLPFEDGTLDALVTTSAFHFFDQPAALREFHRVLCPGGLAAVATLSPRWTLPMHRLSANRFNPAHNPSPAEMRALFQDAGFHVSDQHRVHRPAWTRLLSDLITFGVRP
jgi:SAM-dependent methyltransferase